MNIYICKIKIKKRYKYKEKKKKNKFKRKYSPNLIILDYLYNVPPNQCSFVDLINIYYKKNIF